MPKPTSDQAPLILVADDESHIVHVVTLKLRNAGYRVISAQDGQEALDLAFEHRPALVITDYQMPRVTGLELCQRLKADERTRRTPALMLTARGFSLGEEVLAATNITSVMSKPFSPREVLGHVQKLLSEQADESTVPAK